MSNQKYNPIDDIASLRFYLNNFSNKLKNTNFELINKEEVVRLI